MSHTISIIFNKKHNHKELVRYTESYFGVVPINKTKKDYYSIDKKNNLIINVMSRQILFSQLNQEDFREESLENIKKYIVNYFNGETVSILNFDREQTQQCINFEDTNIKVNFI